MIVSREKSPDLDKTEDPKLSVLQDETLWESEYTINLTIFEPHSSSYSLSIKMCFTWFLIYYVATRRVFTRLAWSCDFF